MGCADVCAGQPAQCGVDEAQLCRHGCRAEAPPGMSTACGAALGAPMQASLHFAGSETASKWVGYMEGAIEAGQRATGEVLSAQKAEVQSKL